jgi:hypothetical protein
MERYLAADLAERLLVFLVPRFVGNASQQDLRMIR